MIKVALTGGIGSGKSTVSAIFEMLGIAVYDCDAHAKRILAYSVVDDVKKLLGNKAYKNGLPDRAYIASKVFADKELLDSLNAIIHPAVMDDYMRWTQNHSDDPYTVVESAILFESGFDKIADIVIIVTAPQEVRIERAMRRDGSSREAVLSRIAAQMEDREAVSRADYLLFANERQLLIPQIIELDKKLR